MDVLRDGQAHWSLEAHLLDDLRVALTSTEKQRAKIHPARPKPTGKRKPDSPERRSKLADARRRARQRRARREAGEL